MPVVLGTCCVILPIVPGTCNWYVAYAYSYRQNCRSAEGTRQAKMPRETRHISWLLWVFTFLLPEHATSHISSFSHWCKYDIPGIIVNRKYWYSDYYDVRSAMYSGVCHMSHDMHYDYACTSKQFMYIQICDIFINMHICTA